MLGARLGWIRPFGDAYAEGVVNGPYYDLIGVRWRDFASSGPSLELDAGARLARDYTVFLLWERAYLGAGDSSRDTELYGDPQGGNTDFYALGLRASSDADAVGLLTEICLGYRRARTEWDDGTALELTEAIFEARLSLGVDIRLNRMVSLTPMVSLGFGSFGKAELVEPDGTAHDLIRPDGDQDTHGWYGLSMGGQVDLFAGK